MGKKKSPKLLAPFKTVVGGGGIPKTKQMNNRNHLQIASSNQDEAKRAKLAMVSEWEGLTLVSVSITATPANRGPP